MRFTPTQIPTILPETAHIQSERSVKDWKSARIVGHNPVWGEQNLNQKENVESNNHIGFKDILDSFNPLQQIPVIGQAYRSATNETVSPISRVIGGAVFGGPIGVVAALASIAFEGATGSDPISYVLNGFNSTKNISSDDDFAQFDKLIQDLNNS